MNGSVAKWALLVWSIFLISASCGSGSGEAPSFETAEMGELPAADQSSVDIEWADETVVADEATVMSDLEDLQPWNDVYRVPADSDLLDGIEQGTIVVWPQVGVLEIQQINPDGDAVEVHAEAARFSDAVTSANIEFSHALEAGEPGRAVGMKPAVDGSMASQGLARQAISADPGQAKYTKDGVAYTSPSGNISTTLGMQGDTIDVDFKATSNNIDLSVTGDVSGMKADGRVTVDPEAEDPDPTVIINFEDISANVTGKLSVDGAKGDQEILPGAVVVFPFAAGPVPMFVAVGLRFQLRSSISSTETYLEIESGFSMDGSVSLGRNIDGSFGAEGTIDSFEARDPGIKYETGSTAGIGLDVDTPRISFGIGRPKLASAAVFGTHSYEIVGNVTVYPDDWEFCARAETGSAILVGGEVTSFGWTASQAAQIANQSGASAVGGEGCE